MNDDVKTLHEYTATGTEGPAGFVFYCPGCKYPHALNISDNEPGPRWTWNGDREKPTFQPSVLVHGSEPAKRCHLFVTAGKIQFLDDCFHEFKGQTVDLPPFQW